VVETAEEIKRQLGTLRRRDPRISHAIKAVGFPGPRMMSPGFATLTRIIIDQQVSTAAGAAIWAKLRKAAGNITPARLLALGERGLRSCGLSSQKARYTLGIADATAARTLNFAALSKADDAAVREALMAFKGVGVWTADIYLMFGMGRPDIWPVGDLGLQNAVQLLHGLKVRPTPKAMEEIAEPWRPYRTSAAILLWRYYGASRPKAGIK
jgi:DNA-3-methyladenine glycosylase II